MSEQAATAEPPVRQELKDFHQTETGPDGVEKKVPFDWRNVQQQTFIDPRSDEDIRNGVLPKPAEEIKNQEDERARIYEQRKRSAFIEYICSKVKALTGNPESFTPAEVQKMADLFPCKVLSFDEWWSIQLQRETEQMRAEIEQRKAQSEKQQ